MGERWREEWEGKGGDGGGEVWESKFSLTELQVFSMTERVLYFDFSRISFLFSYYHTLTHLPNSQPPHPVYSYTSHRRLYHARSMVIPDDELMEPESGPSTPLTLSDDPVSQEKKP